MNEIKEILYFGHICIDLTPDFIINKSFAV